VTERTIAVLGATSAIARGIADAFARRGCHLYLAGRSEDEVSRLASDLRIRHQVRVAHAVFDAVDTASHAAFFRRMLDTTGGRLDGLVVAFGTLGQQDRAATDFEHAREIIDVNFLGAASMLSLAANEMEARGTGFLAAISSVAGDRGRQSNYVYGAAKGGLSLFLQGLRNRLSRSGVRVHTIKPGFVDTQMTYGMPGLFLVASPAQVGERVVRAIERGRDVIYVPGFWRWVMFLIRMIPERVFKRMKL
jgi:decaprenylphospho-beta-D-erythro-pentofuranosid-2-ulose 2-reductase